MSGLSSKTGLNAFRESSTVTVARDDTKFDGLVRLPLSLLLFAQQAKLDKIRLDGVPLAMVGWFRTATARQRRFKAGRHGRVRSGAAAWVLGRFKHVSGSRVAHGGSLATLRLGATFRLERQVRARCGARQDHRDRAILVGVDWAEGCNVMHRRQELRRNHALRRPKWGCRIGFV